MIFSSKRSGFSTLEILLVSAMFLGLVFILASFRDNVDDLNNLVGQKLQSRQDLDRFTDQMITEIRSAAPSSQGAYPILAASTSSFTFYSDVDSDNVFERIRYLVSSTTLQRGILEPSGNPLIYDLDDEVITTGIENVVNGTSTPIFTYYGDGYTGTQDPLSATSTEIAAIRSVLITIYADINPENAPKPAFIRQFITIRNLLTNN